MYKLNASEQKAIGKKSARKRNTNFISTKDSQKILESKMNAGKPRAQKQNISFLSAKYRYQGC